MTFKRPAKPGVKIVANIVADKVRFRFAAFDGRMPLYRLLLLGDFAAPVA